jgi:hypothetical protein
MDKSEKIIILSVVGTVAGCLLIALLCAGVFLASKKINLAISTPVMPTLIPMPTTQPTATTPVCSVQVQDSEVDLSNGSALIQSADQTQAALEQAVIPTANLNDLAERLMGLQNIPTHLDTPPVQYQIGDRLNFYKLDGDNNNILTSASLRYATDTVYFWAEDDIVLNESDLKTLVDIFSNQIYPTDHAFFGSEWIPGVDNDPHLFILYARGLGDSLSGYFSSGDYVLPEADKYSNAHEMFVINADDDSITDPYTLSTMAHEFQHVIMGHIHPSEELWMNEGFSELATLINGYEAGGFDASFVEHPDMQLTDWSPDPNLNDLNYGASYLFTTYLYSRFGQDVTHSVITDPQNGLASIDDVFTKNNILDPETGNLYTADEFFRDWTLTNYLNNPDLQNGRYYYSKYPNAPKVNNVNFLSDCNGSSISESVHQYGTDYYQLECDQPVTLKFSGAPTNNILSDNGENSTYIMWSNRADTADTTMTRVFDLTNVSGLVTLNFNAWFDLEPSFDFVYLEASVDGSNWQILNTSSCLISNTSGTGYGCGFTGQSQGWQQQIADLSAFAGKLVALRFEMISDGGISNEGFAVDNLTIPQIGYSETFEEGDGGWVAQGFARILNEVPQTFLVSLITSDPANPIKKYRVTAGEELDLHLDPNCMNSYPLLVVSGSSRYTRQLADYTLTLSQ